MTGDRPASGPSAEAGRRTAVDFVPDATSGNTTSIEIAAGSPIVWDALTSITFDDLRVTVPLMAVRSLPARLARRGALAPDPDPVEVPPVLQAMTSGRFTELHRRPGHLLTLGVIGQFWRLAGGEDVPIADGDHFVGFAEPGFVVTAIDFRLDRTSAGTTLVTETRNRPTDPRTARRFGWYWRLIGPGSKLIRIDILRAVRTTAERHAGPMP